MFEHDSSNRDCASTIAGDLYYGPFPGKPRTCTFYPDTYEIGRAARVLGN